MTVASTLAILSLLFPPVGIVSSAAVALVTLRKGAYEGGLVLLASGVAAALMGHFVIHNFQFAFGYGLVLWIPIWLIATVLREGKRLSLALEICTFLGVLGVVALYLYSGDPAPAWREGLARMFEPMLAAPGVDRAQAERTLDFASRYMTGIAAAGSVSGMMLGLLLARWWQAILYNPAGFRQEFLAVRIRPWVAYVFLAVIVLALAGGEGMVSEMAWNVAMLGFVLYLTVGTAVLHSLLAASKGSRYSLPVLYLVMLFIPHALLPVALIGYGDTWLNLRRRVSA